MSSAMAAPLARDKLVSFDHFVLENHQNLSDSIRVEGLSEINDLSQENLLTANSQTNNQTESTSNIPQVTTSSESPLANTPVSTSLQYYYSIYNIYSTVLYVRVSFLTSLLFIRVKKSCHK
jgi:hypothetical protein